MSKLVFKMGEETLPTIMKDELGTSPFNTAMNKGKKELTALLKTACKPIERDSFVNKQRFFSNNVVSFLGDRGSGKTSCMLSLIHMFQTDNKDEETFKLGEETFFMPLVDPAFFDQRHNILEIVIGELYRNYKNLSKEWSKKSDTERSDIVKLQGLFAKAKTALHFLNKKEVADDLDENEELLSLSYGVDLNRIIEDLISQYLKCCEKEVIVIAIDDLDLNLERAYEMMEQIRKYLVLPNVVLLIAAKLSQLQASIAIHYKPILKNKLINDYDGYESVDSEILEMAERYLDKLLPLDQRIFMPSPESYLSCELEIVRLDSEQKASESFETVEFAVLSLIFEKCGFLFYNSPTQPSLIVPGNLRELRLLVSMLYRMESKEAGREVHLKNKEALKKYLFEQWTSTLMEDDLSIIKEILKEHDWTKINKLVISLLNKWFLQNRTWADDAVDNKDPQSVESKELKMLQEITCKANVSENLSIGDVWFIMEKTREKIPSERIDRLLFSLSTLYSIWLYELYDDLTENIQEGKNKKVESLNSLPHLKNTEIIECHDFFKLVGNSFFTLSGDSVIPLSQAKKPRELVMIDGLRLGKEIAEIKNIIKSKSEEFSKEEFIIRMQMIEFFMLGCSRWVEP
ncbi:MAG: KAP family NTPase, partial [Ruminococcus sp.]|nr:KAP family NTPase [Ruminococcus sp.]